jgi:hypothetical protein
MPADPPAPCVRTPAQHRLAAFDVVRIGRQHLRDGALHVKPQKTGGPVLVIQSPELAAAIDAGPSGNLTI